MKMDSKMPIVQIPAVSKSLQFEENEDTFKIEVQMFVYDCFQRKELILNEIVQISLSRDRFPGNFRRDSFDDDNDPNNVYKEIKKASNIDGKSFKTSSDYFNFITHQAKDTSTRYKSKRRRYGHKNSNYKNYSLITEPNNNEIYLDEECYIIDDDQVGNIFQKELDNNAEIPIELKTTDYTLLTQVTDNSTFINLQGEYDNDVNMLNFDTVYETENNANGISENVGSHYVVRSVMKGDVYMTKKNTESNMYDKCIDPDSDESYPMFNVDGDQDFHPRNDMKKTDVRCDKCGRKCRSLNALNHHMLVHSEARPFVCQICKKAFKEQPTLRRHMWTHMAKQHQCDICKKYFVEKSSLRRHMSTIHADFRPGPKAGHSGSKQQFCCSKCSKVFKSLTKFNMHAQMHGNPNYECDVCGKVYAGRSHLRIHQRIHTGEKPFQCTICAAKFAFKHVLKSHQARIHHRINKYKCNLCSLVFLKKSDLSNHASCHMISMKKEKRSYNAHKNNKYKTGSDYKKQKGVLKCNLPVNDPEYVLFGQLVDISNNDREEDCKIEELFVPDEKPNGTNYCGDKYFSTWMTNEKKDKRCKKCLKEFERTGDLKRHIISHIVQDITLRAKEVNQSMPHYVCSICGLTGFNQVDKFKAHLREHAKLTLYKCKFCERAFGDSSNYSKHKKVHGNKYLQCDMCKRKFNTKRMLISHMEYHKGHPPMRCGHCNKEFYFQSSFRKHIKISHQGKANVTYKCEHCGDRFKTVKEKWEHQWEQHEIRKVQADCDVCGAKFRKLCLLRAHILKEHGETNEVVAHSPNITIKEEPLDIFTNTEFLMCNEDIDLDKIL